MMMYFLTKKKRLAISVDTYTEGNHFINFKNPELVIKKILRSSISDLICKGVVPKYYFISVSGNKNTFTKSNLSKMTKSLNEEQQKYNIYLGGGDTVSALQPNSIHTGFSHISTGGGASLEFMEGKELPGIAALPDA